MPEKIIANLMKGRKDFTPDEIETIKLLIAKKLKANTSDQKSIRTKIRKMGFHAADYGLRGGYTVTDFLNTVNKVVKYEVVVNNKLASPISTNRKDSDEAYIINICDMVLKEVSKKQHRFDFLRGDTGVKLPVDAYYQKHNLVIEYMEKQHSEPVKFFDKKQTVSGVGRGEQRKIYDERRKKVIPENGIDFLTLSFKEFKYKSNKTLIRHLANDKAIVKFKLSKYL